VPTDKIPAISDLKAHNLNKINRDTRLNLRHEV